MKQLLFSLIILFGTNHTVAQDFEIQSNLGDQTISHPTIEGYKEVQTLAPGVFEFFEGLTPNTNRLLAAYISDADYDKLTQGEEPSLERYFLVQTVRTLEDYSLTKAEFKKVKQQLKGNLSLDSGLGEALSSAIDQAEADVENNNTYIEQLKVDTPTVIALGPETDELFSFTMLVDIAVQTTEDTSVGKIVYETDMIRASSRILYLYVYENFNGDTNWVQQFGEELARQYLTMNPNQ